MSIKIAVIGLGYVGLPLARLFATKYLVVGFDINQTRIDGLRSGTDSTLEVSDEVLQNVLVSSFVTSSAVERQSAVESHSVANGLYVSSNIDDIADCNYYIVMVPTPVD